MEQEFMHNYGKDIVGPVMLEYTRWILRESQKKGIKKLYFLARDGYLLSKIARMIVKKQGLDIDCRYLYCSRASLRMPSYHVIDEDEMYDILLRGGYYVTPKSLFQRGCFSDEEMQKLYDELGISSPDKCLNEQELDALCEKIKKNEFYKKAVLEKSQSLYDATIAYFKSEGLFDDEYIAVADSGWLGSMQHSLSQLLFSAGYRGKIVGFYFGLYKQSKNDSDGEFNSFYFAQKSGTKRKLYFNNNLFECMLSAPHPMTIGYEYDEGGNARPLFAENHSEKMLELINAQIDGALEFIRSTPELPLENYSYKKSQKRAFKLLKRAMVYPTRSEAEMLSYFTFCDDFTEGYKLSLVAPEMQKALKEYNILRRAIKKALGKKQSGKGQLFWPYGVIAYSSKIARPFHRFNVLLWDYLKIKFNKI